ncbi:MAG: SOS response-associated peptidase [Ignavibacteria bacterium]|nr:SOS response-associated peptidase [Ignavibacteria bacterium]
MCYTVSIFASTHEIETDLGATFDDADAYQPYFNVSGFVHPALPMVSSERPDAIQILEWGLIPRWIRDLDAASDIANKTLNARGDTVFEKSSFKDAIVSRRSLLPVNGFIEWRHEKKSKLPFFVRGIQETLITLGCIFEEWTDRNSGEHKKTFSILTTDANELMAYIHNNKLRMPVVIGKADRSAWLSDIDRHTIEQLMRPLCEHQLQAIPLSREISHITVNTDNADLLKPIGTAIVDPLVNNN